MLSFFKSLIETEEEKQKMADIYEEYRYYCIYIAKQLLRNHDDAEDATHAAFLEIIARKEKYFAMECSDFRASLVVIVKHKAIDILRQHKKENVDDVDPIDDLTAIVPSADEIVAIQEEYNMLRKALKELSPSYDNILTLKYFEGYNNSEIANILHTKKKNVEIALYRAKTSLRIKLNKMEGDSNGTPRL